MLPYNPYARKKRSRPIESISQQHVPKAVESVEITNHVSARSDISTSSCGQSAPHSRPLHPSVSRELIMSSNIDENQRKADCRPPLAMRQGNAVSTASLASILSSSQKKAHTSVNTSSKGLPIRVSSSIGSDDGKSSRPEFGVQSKCPPGVSTSKYTATVEQKTSPISNPYLATKRRETARAIPPPLAQPETKKSPSPLVTTEVPPNSSSIQTENRPLPPTKKQCLANPPLLTGSTSALPLQSTSQPPDSKSSNLGSIRPPSWVQKTEGVSTVGTAQLSTTSHRMELPGEAMLPTELLFSPEDVKPVDDGNRKALVRNANLQKPLFNGWTLYSHQKKAILQGLVKRRMILALDMGLGKTLIGCVWARSYKLTFANLKVFVVCPVSLKTEWKRTAENATGLSVEDEKANSSDPSLDMKICSWAKVPTKVESNVDRFVAVFDEAHSMQSMTAARTKDAMKLVSDERCEGVLLLTGTPMKNGKPINLFPLLKAVRHPLGRDQMAYEKHFCAGVLKNFGRGKPVWDANGCSNLKQLKRLASSNLLHLTKDQCLTLPPLKRERYKVPISHRNQLQYIQAVKNLASLQAAAFENKDMGEAVLGGVQKLRSLCSFAKIGATVELAKKILEEEPSVVIFTSFATVAKSIHDQLSSSGWDGELLTGETPQKKRQSMVDNFQAGHSAVFVCTFGAGGVGLTLTAACSIILLDRPWTPGDTRQAEDRIRRIGQTKTVKSFWMSGFELDKQIDDMILTKEEASNAVLTEGAVSAGPAAKINIPKLLQCLIAKVS